MWGTFNAISYDKRIVQLHQYFPKWVHSAQYGCSLISCFLVMVFSEWFWDGPSFLYFYWNNWSFSASFLITFLFPEIARSFNTQVPFFIITDYDFRFIVMDGPVGLHCWFRNMATLFSWLVSTNFATCPNQWLLLLLILLLSWRNM